MALVKYKSNCNGCIKSKTDKKFRERVRYAAFKRQQGDETLGDIAEEFGLNQAKLYNHAKKHLVDVSQTYAKNNELKQAKKTINLRTEAQKELEVAIEGDVVDTAEARPAEVIALDDYIAQAKALIDKGELKINATSFLTAVKIRTDWAAKQKSTKLDYLKTIYALASKEKETNGPATERSESTGSAPEAPTMDSRGTGQPESLYQSAVRTPAP